MKAEIAFYDHSRRMFVEEVNPRAKETVASLLRRAANNAFMLLEATQGVTSFEIKVHVDPEETLDA